MLNGKGHDSRSHYCTPESQRELRLLRSLTEEISPIFADVAKHKEKERRQREREAAQRVFYIVELLWRILLCLDRPEDLVAV